MKGLVTLLLPAAISAAVLETRQAGKGGKGGAAPKQANYKVSSKVVQAQFRAGAKREIVRIGPFDLLPGLSGRHGMSLDSNGQGINFNIPKGSFCGGKDCTILSGGLQLQFEDGSPADVSKGVYNHHVLASNSQKRIEPFHSQCDTATDLAKVSKPKSTVARFIGNSDDNADTNILYGTKDGSIEGGYWLGKENQIGVWADIVNLDKTQKKIYLAYDVEYIPGHVGVDGQGTLMSVQGCSGRRINASPSGPSNTTSGKFKFFRDGHVFNGKGHLHDGGVAMDLLVNGKEACSSNAKYGGEGFTTKQNGKVWETIAGMTICPGPIKVKEGDYMQLRSRYDLTKHPLRQAGSGKMAEIMGMWTMTFLPDKNGAGAGVAKQSKAAISKGGKRSYVEAMSEQD